MSSIFSSIKRYFGSLKVLPILNSVEDNEEDVEKPENERSDPKEKE